MEINTKFGVWDRAFLLEDWLCYSVKIIDIDVTVKSDELFVEYGVKKTVPTGILSEKTVNIDVKQEDLFLDKQEVKEKIKENEKIVEDYRNLKEGENAAAYISWMYTSVARSFGVWGNY